MSKMNKRKYDRGYVDATEDMSMRLTNCACLSKAGAK